MHNNETSAPFTVQTSVAVSVPMSWSVFLKSLRFLLCRAYNIYESTNAQEFNVYHLQNPRVLFFVLLGAKYTFCTMSQMRE